MRYRVKISDTIAAQMLTQHSVFEGRYTIMEGLPLEADPLKAPVLIEASYDHIAHVLVLVFDDSDKATENDIQEKTIVVGHEQSQPYDESVF